MGKYYLTEKRIYSIYQGMIQRCTNPMNKKYHRYGGRGIKVCKEWSMNLDNFIIWAKCNGYKEGLQIDRIDNDGNYEPGNCRWVTNKENCRNTSKTILLEHNGVIKPAIEIAETVGVKSEAVVRQVKHGHSVDEALSFLARRIRDKAEGRRSLKAQRIAELKKIIDENYCFFQMLD
jgi:hypothetical protein